MIVEENSRARALAAISIGCAALAVAVGSLANSTGVKLHEWTETRPARATIEETR